MTENDEHNRRFDEAGRDILIKGMMFTVGLAFAVLAASIQTFDVDRQDCATKLSQWIEVVGWIGLLVSGFAGILWIRFSAPRYIKLGRGEDDQRLSRRSKCSQNVHHYSLLGALVLLALARAILALVPATAS